MYNIDGLQTGIDNCRKNIQIFEDAIRKEKETIRQYEFFIAQLVRKEKKARAEAKEEPGKEVK